MDYREQFAEECRKIVGNVSGLSVLVPGCGAGLDCRLLAAAGAHITGMDISDDLGASFSHPNVAYLRGSIEGCDLPSDHFDLVFCIATMEHVGGIEKGFAEMVRLARPGGLVYSAAAPLWNSRRGHHLECLNPFPWIHLRLAPDQIVTWAHERNITHQGIGVEHMMDYLFVSPYFNRWPAERYINACRDLPVSQMLRNDLWLDGEDELTECVMSELDAKGYTRNELLATAHTLVARK